MTPSPQSNSSGIERRDRESYTHLKEKERERPFAWMTACFIGINVLVFLVLARLVTVQSGTHDLWGDIRQVMIAPLPLSVVVTFGAKGSPPLMAEQPWRFLATLFLHSAGWHLAINMSSLAYFGTRLERRMGHGRYAAVYLLSGLFGTTASVFVYPHLFSVGASAAVYGVFTGFLVVDLVYHRVFKRPLWLLLLAYSGVLLVTLALAAPSSDTAAHLGGILMGGALTVFLVPYYIRSVDREGREQMLDKNRLSRRYSVVVGALAFILLLGWLTRFR